MKHFKKGIMVLAIAALLVGFLALGPRPTKAGQSDPLKNIRTYNIAMNIGGNNIYTVTLFFDNNTYEEVKVSNVDVLATFIEALSKKGTVYRWASNAKMLEVLGISVGTK